MLGNRVRARRDELDLTQGQVAKLVRELGGELSQQQLHTIEKGDVKRPRCLKELAEALRTTQDFLLGNTDDHFPTAQIGFNGHKKETVGGKGLQQTDSASTLGVWETTPGSGRMGEAYIRENVVDSVVRPVQLQGAKKALAFRILDDTQDPAFRDGDIAYVDRMRKALPGEDCLLARPAATGRTDAYHVIPRFLISSTADSWRVRQYNPRREYDLPKADWPEAWKIQGKYSR